MNWQNPSPNARHCIHCRINILSYYVYVTGSASTTGVWFRVCPVCKGVQP